MPRHHSAGNGSQSTSDQNRHLQHDFGGVQFQHIALLSVTAIFCGLIQVKFQQAKASPFDTHQGVVMSASVVAMFVYVMALLAEAQLRSRNSNYSGIMGRISFLSGGLMLVLLLLVLVASLGWMMLVIWFAFFVKKSLDVCQELYRLLDNAVAQAFDMLNRLMGRDLPQQQNSLPEDIP